MTSRERHIDLSHVIEEGMVTYPGLPTPSIADHLTRQAAEGIYGPGITFQIGLVTMCTNTGTYLDVPFHRYADGHDLTELALERVASVPAVMFTHLGRRVIDLADEDLATVTGCAVLIRTDHSNKWGTDGYHTDHPALDALAKVACVGIDTLNIDATEGTGDRPVHSILLAAGIPIVEHLTNLAELPPTGFRFSAVPPKISGAGTFTVRAYASVPA